MKLRAALLSNFVIMTRATDWKCTWEDSSLQNFIPEGDAPVTFLPQHNDLNSAPACLDGSPYGFYYVPSTTNSTKWTISINGGGWCYDEEDCACRSTTILGTSKLLSPTGGCDCWNPREDGSLYNTCHCIHLPYCDGASFSGFRTGAWLSPNGTELFFRGIRNLDGVLDFALAQGMDQAEELVVTGSSAGGLSTFLHLDRVAARVPAATKVRGAPEVGYFLDHDNFAHSRGAKPNTPEWKRMGTAANYTTWMKYIYGMQNLTFGEGLSKECQQHYPTKPWLCFMSPRMQKVIQTPYFMFNSKYDSWQLNNELQISSWDTPEKQLAVLKYGRDFMEQFQPVLDNPSHGGMITSCVCHGCDWKSLVWDGKDSYQHYADWFYGKTSGMDAIHIDTRLPNGNGIIISKYCEPFSYSISATL